MKKRYMPPEWEIETFTVPNVLTVSNTGPGQGGGNEEVEF